jgi:hypothetical protein
MTDRKKLSLPTLFAKAAKGEPITMLTCYDYPTGYLQEQAGIDMILVGDSLGMTMLGYDSTLPVTMEDMIRHSQAVRRGAPTAWLIGDMPYMSYQPSVESAIRNAGRFMAEAGCDAIKLEGGREMADRLAGIVAAGIPAMGHLGLTPQSVSRLWAVFDCRTRQPTHQIIGRPGASWTQAPSHPLRVGPRPAGQRSLNGGDELPDHQPGVRTPSPRSTADLPRHVRAVPALQAAHGQGLRRGRESDPGRPAAVRAGSAAG